MKIEEYKDAIFSALEKDRFTNMEDDLLEFLPYSSEFENGITKYLCLDDIRIKFQLSKKELLTKEAKEDLYYYNQLDDSDKRDGKFTKHKATFYFNQEEIFTLSIVLVYFSGTQYFFAPYHRQKGSTTEIEKKLSQFLTLTKENRNTLKHYSII